MPQFVASVEVSTQRPPHKLCPTGHGAFGATIALPAEPMLSAREEPLPPPMLPWQPKSKIVGKTAASALRARKKLRQDRIAASKAIVHSSSGEQHCAAR
jgi:hypothetical protein